MMGEFIFGIINTSVVTGLSIAAAGILLRVSRKRYSARCRKRIWIFMGLYLFIPFHLLRFPGAYTAQIPNVVLREADSQAVKGAGGEGMTGRPVQSMQNQTELNQTEPNPAEPNQAEPNPAVDELPSPVSGQGIFKAELTMADVLFAVWACMGVLLMVYYAVGYRKMRSRIRRWSSECEDGHAQEVIREVAAECKLKRLPEVRIMKDSIEGPFTTGIMRSIIILPEEALKERDLRFILKHEMIHCRNHDIPWRLFFLTVNIIHWFNPLAWYLRRAMEQDMEIACDEEVVSRASREKRKEYSDVIMSWVERSRHKGSAVSTGYVKEVGFLKRRFDSIINGGKKKNGILLAGGVCILALFIGCVIQLQDGGKVYADEKDKEDKEMEVPETPVRLQVFSQEDVKVAPGIREYDFDEACAMGEVHSIYGTLPGLAEGTWYIVTVDGVEYYYGQYDFSADRTELFGWSIVGGGHSLANGISLGMTKNEVLERYPAMAILDMEGSTLNGVTGHQGWNSAAYPSSPAGMDENLEYADGKDYFWEEQFDAIMIAEVEQPMDELPVYVALMMKDDTVAAITFYYPTAN